MSDDDAGVGKKAHEEHHAPRDGPLGRFVLCAVPWSVYLDLRRRADHHTHRGGVYVRDAPRPGIDAFYSRDQAAYVDACGDCPATDRHTRADGVLSAPPDGRCCETMGSTAEC